MMYQAEGYWVVPDGGGQIQFRSLRDGQYETDSYGSAGVRYYRDFLGEGEAIVIATGGPTQHTSGTAPTVTLTVGSAVGLIDNLKAAVRDARIADGEPLEPLTYADITCKPCSCWRCRIGGA
ncbi:hypothetical protein ACWDYH_29720 [Nocardia goodfellowii]